jgi:hypothetical protein
MVSLIFPGQKVIEDDDGLFLIRMNVAITRAKELLVVIGNGALLQRDPYWKAFLGFTIRHKL